MPPASEAPVTFSGLKGSHRSLVWGLLVLATALIALFLWNLFWFAQPLSKDEILAQMLAEQEGQSPEELSNGRKEELARLKASGARTTPGEREALLREMMKSR